MKLESTFGVCLIIEGKPDMAWDNFEIQQSMKEQALEVSAIQGVPLLNLAEKTEPDAEGGEKPEAEAGEAEEPPRKKGRRRSRHKKKKIAGGIKRLRCDGRRFARRAAFPRRDGASGFLLAVFAFSRQAAEDCRRAAGRILSGGLKRRSFHAGNGSGRYGPGAGG